MENKNKFVLFLTMVMVLSLFATSTSANDVVTVDHSTNISLEPKWSESNSFQNYTAAITNFGPSKVNEVRIYQNPEYDDFNCYELNGWQGPFFYGNYNDPVTGDVTNFCWWYVPSDSALVFNGASTQSFEFSAITPQASSEGTCNLPWTIETRDVVSNDTGGDWLAKQVFTGVDDYPPVVSTSIIGTNILYEGDSYIKPDETIIRVNASDNHIQCQSGIDYCEWRYSLNGNWNSWQTVEGNGESELIFDIIFPTDSNHSLEILCFDVAGFESNLIQEDYILDGTAPETLPSLHGPYYQGVYEQESVLFLNGVSNVTLHPTDNKFNAGGITTQYQHYYFENPNDWDYCTSNAGLEMNNPQLYEGEAIGNFNESCNVIIYRSIDELNNTEFLQYLRFFVDKTPPDMTKILGEPKIPFEEGEGWYLTSNTSVSLICEDQDPHPSGVAGLYYRFGNRQSADANWNWYSGNGANWIFVPNDSFDFTFNQSSEHILEWYCEDNVEKESNVSTQYYRVDNTGPIINKTVTGPQFGDCPPMPNSDDECFVNDETNITFSAHDADSIHAVHNLQCTWSYEWNNQIFQGGEFVEGEVITVNFDNDSEHILTIICEDGLGNTVEDVERFLVDIMPPETNKEYCDLNFLEDGFRWITSDTQITLTASDIKSGVNNIKWRYAWYSNDTCMEHPTDINILELNSDWIESEGNETSFKISDSSCHVIQYFAVDNLNNSESINQQFVMVDNEAPNMTKIISEPKLLVNQEICLTENTSMTDIQSLSTSSFAQRTGTVWESNELGIANIGIGPCTDATNPSQCAYVNVTDLPAFAIDALEAKGADLDMCSDRQVLILSSGNPMDNTISISTDMENSGCGLNPDDQQTYDCVDLDYTPNTEKLVVSMSAEYPAFLESITDWMRIQSSNVSIDVSINDWDSDMVTIITTPNYGPSSDGSGVIQLAVLPSGQLANLRVADSSDAIYDSKLIVLDSECFDVVDTLIPDITEDPDEPPIEPPIEPPSQPTSQCFDYYHYVTQSTKIELLCEDNDNHPVEGEKIKFKVFNDGKDITSSYCSENNLASSSSCSDNDLTSMNGGGCNDETPENDYCVIDGTYHELYFMEDSEHVLEWYCVDELGNMDEDSQFYFVDTLPPITEHNILEPWFHDNNTNATYIDTETLIELIAFDQEPHPSNVNKTMYYWEQLNDEACWEIFDNSDNGLNNIDATNGVSDNFNEYVGPFGIPDESCHVIRYYSIDNLGNKENVNYLYVFVDKSPPVIEKEYSDLYYEYHNETMVKWITSLTNISIDVYDPEPHPSGVALSEYRYTMVDDEYCWTQNTSAQGNGAWNTPNDFEEFTFNIPQDSCHLIEIRSTDNVNKTNVHKQVVFVDNQAPDTSKIIGTPKSIMSQGNIELGHNYFNEDNGFEPALTPEFCALGDQNCMEVTLLTTIDLACEDPDPHPSGASSVYFKVHFNAADETEYYCNLAEGSMTDDDYCYLEDGTNSFHFQKETWHRLEYYCEDNVGNIGEPDVEYFKVEGTAFNIELNKKWNLISVPVKLLDNSMDEVFEGHDNVVSVWGFDGYNWTVWSHDGPNDLTTMEPGWGYWVLTTNESTLQIGGSLLSPAVTPPSINIVYGWNLIGYYGADNAPSNNGVPYYAGPNLLGDGKPASCALATLVSNWLDAPFPSLWTYWEPENPNMWMPLDAMNYNDYMNPGAGYWLFYSKDNGGIYGPSTLNCMVFE